MNAAPELVAQLRRDLAALVKHADAIETALVGLVVQPTDEAARALVERHIELRSLGELVSREMDEADALLRLAVDDEASRQMVSKLADFSELGRVFRVLSKVLPRSFRAVTAEQEKALRSVARAAADRRVWPDLPVRLRDVWVPPPATVSNVLAGTRTRTRTPTEPSERVEDAVDALREAMINARVVVLAGVAGNGRTTVAAMLADAVAEEEALLPLWLDRAALVQLPPTGPLTCFGLNERALIHRGGVVGIADGVDDLPDRAAVLDALLGAAKRSVFSTLVLTLRRESLSSLPPLDEPYPVIELEPFDHARVAAWSQRWQLALDGSTDGDQGFDGTRYLDAPTYAADELGGALSDLVQLPFGLALLANLHAHKRPLPDPSTTRRRAALIREVLDGTCAEVAQRVGVTPALARDALRRLAIFERAAAREGARRDRWREHLELAKFSEVLAELERSFLLRDTRPRVASCTARSAMSWSPSCRLQPLKAVAAVGGFSSGFVVEDREAAALWRALFGICEIDCHAPVAVGRDVPRLVVLREGAHAAATAPRGISCFNVSRRIFLHLMKDDALDTTVSIARATDTPHSLVVVAFTGVVLRARRSDRARSRRQVPGGYPRVAAYYARAVGHIQAESSDRSSWTRGVAARLAARMLKGLVGHHRRRGGPPIC
ncbi:MAG: hypothetical protein R3A52_02745 [Polyangiales bacterium]